MNNVLFIQGAGEGTHEEWDNKLVESLERELGPSYSVRYPKMPNEAQPSSASWQPVISKELVALGDGAIVVGHSVGGTLLMSALARSASTASLAAIVLIAAPFTGEGGWDSEEMESSENLAPLIPSHVPVFLYHGTDDEEVPPAHVDLYAKAFPHATLRRLTGHDHQFNNDLSEVARDLRGLR